MSMLRLVDTPSTPAPELRRVGLYGFEPDLERYVRHALGARWPRLVLTVALEPDELLRVRQQLWLCALVPPEGTRSPVLWLDGIGTSAGQVRLAPNLWRITAPVTATRLLRAVDDVLAADARD